MISLCRSLILILVCLPAAAAAAPLSVFVSIPPQRYLLQRIAGDHVDIGVMLTPGQSPETFDPSARQMQRLAGAGLYFLAGVPFEANWAKSLANAYTALRLVPCCGDLDPARMVDPHYWTSPANAMNMAESMYAGLAAADPANAGTYHVNLDRLLSDLKVLDAYIRERLKQRRTSVFITAHAAWGWFARQYGLQEEALERNGREIGPRGLTRLLDIARREQIHTVFVQQQYRTPVVTTLARQLDADLVSLDPLAGDYLGNMRSVADKMAKALQ